MLNRINRQFSYQLSSLPLPGSSGVPESAGVSEEALELVLQSQTLAQKCQHLGLVLGRQAGGGGGPTKKYTGNKLESRPSNILVSVHKKSLSPNLPARVCLLPSVFVPQHLHRGRGEKLLLLLLLLQAPVVVAAAAAPQRPGGRSGDAAGMVAGRWLELELGLVGQVGGEPGSINLRLRKSIRIPMKSQAKHNLSLCQG